MAGLRSDGKKDPGNAGVQSPGRRFPAELTNYRRRVLQPVTAFVLLLFLLVTPAAAASGIILSTPQSGYFSPVGEEAIVPLTIVSMYDHDVTGTLTLVLTPVNPAIAGNATPAVRSRAFSAFTDSRTVSLPVGRSEVPADYFLAVTFSYDEGGGRTASLDGIRIRFVTQMEEPDDGQGPLTGTDAEDPASPAAGGGTPEKNHRETGSSASALQNTQLSQDSSALKTLLSGEGNRSAGSAEDLLGHVLSDPLVVNLDRRLTGAGFTRSHADAWPDGNRSGRFLLTYSAGTTTATVRGIVRNVSVQFAEATSADPRPLPAGLTANATFRAYADRVAGEGFTLSGIRINATPSRETVNLTYQKAGRAVSANAVLQNGTVTAFEGGEPGDPLARLLPALGMALALLIGAGIWYLARTRPAAVPPPAAKAAPFFPGTCRETALRLLDAAEQDAEQGAWPEAYRKTGRAIRVFLSHEIGQGDEMTGEDVTRLLQACPKDSARLCMILDRCRAVGFAKGRGSPGEFREILDYTRRFLNDRDGGGAGPGR